MAKKTPKQVKPKTGLARCMELASNKKGLIFISAILSSLASIASFIPYIAVYFIIRSILQVYPNLNSLDVNEVIGYGWLALGGIIANILLYFLAIFCSHLAAFGTLYELKVKFAEHITKIPLGYHLTIGSGRLRKIMDENIESVEGFIAHQFPDFVASVTAPIVMVILLFAIDWRFGIASLVGIILAFIVQFMGYGSGAMKENMGKYQIALEDMNNASVEYVRGMESMLSSTIPPLIANGISVTLTCVLLALFDWRLALCVFITLPIAFLVIWCSRKYQIKLFEKQVETKLNASSQVQEYLEGIKIIKSCNLSGVHFRTLNRALLEMKKIAVKVEMVVGIFMSSASMILQAGIGITIFVGTILLVNGQIELLPLLMFFLIVTKIYGPILAILSQLTTLLNLNVVTERMKTLLTTPAMSGKEETPQTYNIKLNDVSFAYNNEDVIHNVSCTIPQGSITALVGPSGSGKSTIAKLIARFWDIQSGSITIGNKNIKTINPENLMEKMSFVFQDVTLFNDTVFNNIQMGNPNATKEQVYKAAKVAYCDEFVRNLPNGYDTILGENGSTLSGGERQRISIARALLKDSPIILLDEATASLDPENEVFVQKALAHLIKGKTVIMIAHRLRTVVDADQILVMENGKIVEHGTHNELMERKGLYHKLYSIQQESLGWSV